MEAEPPDLDPKHISNIVARNVQLSLTPRLQSGRAGAHLDAKYVGKVYRDSIPWMTYALELKGSYPGKVPSSALALIFPKGTKARDSLLAKTAAIRAQLEWAAPKIYGTSPDNDPKSYNIVVMEDIEAVGYPLHLVWPNIGDDQKKAILEKVVDILCAAIHIRPPPDMQARPSPPPNPPRSNANEPATASTSSTTLSDANFTRARLSATNFEHLRKAYTLIYSGLFHPNGEPNEVAFKNRFQDFNTYTMSPQEAVRIRNLHELIRMHMSDFAGGNFLPPHVSGAGKGQFKDAKEKNKFHERLTVVQTILSAPIFRLQHKSMQMSSFIVCFENEAIAKVKSVVLTQWEKAFYAPLWASCHLPPWLEHLDPEIEQPAMPEEEMNRWREYTIYHLMLKKERLPKSWIWFVAHVYGELERHFEMILTATWVWNAKTEPWLKEVLEHAQTKRTSAYKKGSDPFVPLAGVKTMDVNFSECLGKWMPFARKFVAEEGFANLSG